MQTHSMLVGYLLWIFGFLGSHRFYFGKPISGIIWLFTLGLLGIGWLIDLFLIPSMDRQADRRYTPGNYNYTVAWLLLTFLGSLGLHRLYLGKFSGLIIMGCTILAIIFPPIELVTLVFVVIDFLTLNEQVDSRNRGV